jgi:hypothetical protein
MARIKKKMFIINAGMFADANLEYHLNRHFYFDFGMNYEMLLGAGIVV